MAGPDPPARRRDGRARPPRRPTGRRAPQPGHAGHGHAPAASRATVGARRDAKPADRLPFDERLDAAADRRSGRGRIGGSGGDRDVTAADRRASRAVATSPAVGVFQPRGRRDARHARPGRRSARRGRHARRPPGGRRAGRRIVGASLVEAGPGGRVRPGARRDRARRRPGSASRRPPGRARADVFRKILIANRGEIALRVLRACRTLGIEAVVAYSEADRDSLPVQLADEAICIGPADAKRSYLSAPAMISAALVTGCDAIHPGYGFLSEDEGFAEVVRAHDLTFIGPPAAVLERFASKEATRRLLGLARPADDPRLERHPSRRRPRPRGGRADRLPAADQAGGRRRRQGHADGPHAARARGVARRLPVRGAGGVRRRLALPREVARREPPRRGPGRGRPLRAGRPPRRARLLASSAATRRSSRRPRRRPCRRRPAPTCAAGRSGRSSRPATRTSGRSSSSSTATGNFYFIEINCRIQVEHPVTEMLTGIDLVATQIRIAAGEPLGFSQADVALRGHAIEFRINAEDPERDFRPSAGVVERYLPPGRPGRPDGLAPVRRLRGPAVLRLAARQADRLGPDARGGDRPSAGRPRRAAHRGRRHERPDPPGAARVARRSSRAR